MDDLKQRYFFGDTLEQAVLRAASHFSLHPDEVAYQRVEKRHGFLRLRRRVVIEVDPERPRRERIGEPDPLRTAALPETPARGKKEGSGNARRPRRASGSGNGKRGRPRGREQAGRERDGLARPAPPREAAPRRSADGSRETGSRSRRSRGEAAMVTLGERPRRAVERFPAATGPQAEAAGAALQSLLALAELEMEFAVLQGEDRLEIELWGADEERVTDRYGRLLHAFEHLLPRLVRAETGEGVPCRVDCGSFREIREEQLRDLAQRTASEVARHGRPRTLAPMRPDERRIVHLTLADDPSVVTESQGQGMLKRVQVRPA